MSKERKKVYLTKNTRIFKGMLVTSLVNNPFDKSQAWEIREVVLKNDKYVRVKIYSHINERCNGEYDLVFGTDWWILNPSIGISKYEIKKK